ncbi:hypothetical protein NDU88_010661 [Pleurodeles waltl]|uniref:Uncharacterized protein n=1 Tax=Pleurodeles waltl TaxID=8319 RepID=A0AAV7QY50_PLEWA|nr:hypothetical protein NDU88_010661 [Pleurodeles waltl]
MVGGATWCRRSRAAHKPRPPEPSTQPSPPPPSLCDRNEDRPPPGNLVTSHCRNEDRPRTFQGRERGGVRSPTLQRERREDRTGGVQSEDLERRTAENC